MLRGAIIDLQTSLAAGQSLQRIYVRDLESRELSDDAIAAVNTMVRCLEGALGKVTSEVYKHFAKGRATPYFPITADPSRFPELLEKNLPGIRANHPQIAAAVEAQQPYQPGHAPLGLLKALYRENHHHDFTIQERLETQSHELRIGGGMVLSFGEHGISIGGPPPWRGIPISQTQNPPAANTPATPEGPAVFTMTVQPEGTPEVYVNGKSVPQAAGGVEGIKTTWIDWYFKKEAVSVLGTLLPLHDLVVVACSEVWASTGL